MAAFVVDTNVPVVANGDSDMSRDCQKSCIERLQSLIATEQVALDDDMRIIGEYLDNLDADWTGQGVGDQFLKWVLTHQATTRCLRVAITPIDGNGEDYQEFPAHDDLSNFDRSDRKFVAVACAAAEPCSILQAADSKWIHWSEALAECGTIVDFICEDELIEIHLRKQQPKGAKKSARTATSKAVRKSVKTAKRKAAPKS